MLSRGSGEMVSGATSGEFDVHAAIIYLKLLLVAHRIDGVVQDARRSLRKSLSKDAAFLDILPRNTTSGVGDATSGTMISLQFQAGTSTDEDKL